MGNLLIRASPPQLYPLDFYISQFSDLKIEKIIGSTRFLKVVRANKLNLDVLSVSEDESSRSNIVLAYSGDVDGSSTVNNTLTNASHSSKSSKSYESSEVLIVKIFIWPTLADFDGSTPSGTGTTATNSNLILENEKQKIDKIREALLGCANCLPFQRAVITDHGGFVIRQYVKYNLYDRINTRPFLTLIEKKWIAFQILLALQQSHKHGICHGDLKMENVLLTSWNWTFITDFASFKPVFLPEDNPSHFSFFYDMSRRRLCNLPPERFVNTTKLLDLEGESGGGSNKSYPSNSSLSPSMDIFSAGCVLFELFTDTHPFTFPHLLSYRVCEYEIPDQVIQKFPDQDIKVKLLRFDRVMCSETLGI